MKWLIRMLFGTRLTRKEKQIILKVAESSFAIVVSQVACTSPLLSVGHQALRKAIELNSLVFLIEHCFLPTRFTHSERNFLLRGLEAHMEDVEPDHATILEKRQWLSAPPESFKNARSAYDKLYSLKPNGKVF